MVVNLSPTWSRGASHVPVGHAVVFLPQTYGRFSLHIATLRIGLRIICMYENDQDTFQFITYTQEG